MPADAQERLQAPIPDVWDEQTMTAIADINEQLLGSLCLAAQGRAPLWHSPLALTLRSYWQALDAERRRRLSQCPYLLVDLRLPHYAEGGVAGFTVQDSAAPSPHSAAEASLWRQALMLAWHVAQASPLTARLAFDLTSADAARLARLRWQELSKWTERMYQPLRLRWEERPDIWRQLLGAALSDRAQNLRLLQLRGVQLMAGGVYRSAVG